ncbi:hypothetical protein CLCR_05999 [Cladophialophora carrionii]|uniref:Rieske domain-containing protein n=1 Tax=Cladophialophora carrionii TaxID=86049 RepID=A0A1C1C9P4_9EURO|nr:hypothetical protein CLCR_05999 [Cladophialophora carrionii]
MFQTAGSYRVIEHAAGFPLILVLGKDHVLRCFHNVCRHRAYPVISSNKVGCRPNLGCKYHGWTYNLSGKLIQAPKFENAEGFRKDQNSLFEVKTEIDDDGIVTVDLSSESKGNPVLDINKFSKGWTESWEVNGAFNWKVAECADAFKFPTLARNDGDVQVRLGLAGKSKHVKPSILAEFVALPGHNAQLLMTIHPKTAETCTVYCTLFTATPRSASSLTLGSAKSDIAQCVSSLEKLYARVKESDAIPPTVHDLAFLDKLKAHRRLEQSLGRKAWPTSIGGKTNSSRFNIAESLCQELEASVPTCGVGGGIGTSTASFSW